MISIKSIFQIIFSLFLAVTLTVNAKTSKKNNSGPISVIEFGAKADSKTDDTFAFQRALNAASAKGGIVNIPAGTYLITGSIIIPDGVTLQGVWQAPHNTALGKGSVIFATGSADNENGSPLINLTSNSCVKGITVFYPDQHINNVKAYPWTIQGKGTNCSVIDVTLANSYKGIDFGTYSNELHFVRNVYGCPLKVGIFVDNSTDVGRIENVHFNPNAWTRCGYSNSPIDGSPEWDKLIKYLTENLEGFIFARTDWQYVNNCFVIFPKIGFHFISGARRKGNVLITQSGADMTDISVQVDASQKHAGLEFVNCQFMATVIIKPTNEGPIKFTNCGFWSIKTTTSQAIIEGSGTVTFNSTHFTNWGDNDKNAPCVNLKSGTLIMNACEFLEEGKTHIEFGEGALGAVVYGTRFKGGQKIINRAPSTAKIQMGLNLE
ncbi:MAG: glycosyl hydrolase family 28-related protein [Melioribacteraceae bacterium]